MTTPLCDLCVKYGTDKVIWGYTPHYFDWLNEHRHKVKRVLEIGICGHRDIPNNVIGASLWVWHDFFPNAQIYGIDNDARWMVNTDRIHSYCADAYDATQLENALQHMSGGGYAPDHDFDFIVDDAVHDPIPQLSLLDHLFPWVKPGGVYSMEDVCPYKLPGGNLDHMLKFFPPFHAKGVYHTHKDEKLILCRK